MSRRRVIYDNLEPLRRMTFNVRGLEEAARSSELSDYLASANVRFTELSRHAALSANLTRLPLMTFAHVVLPQAVIEWPRDSLSLDRALILIARGRSMEVSSPGEVIHRDPGFFLIPPGDTKVTFRSLRPASEVLYLSVDAACVSDIQRSPRVNGRLSPIQTSIAAPLCGFVTTLCSLTVSDPRGAAPLSDAARQVARALAQMIAGADDHDLDLFTQAMEIIVREHPRADLSVATLAHRLHVSTRTLQAAFTKEGSSVSAELRQTRARAALEIRRRNPNLTARSLAAATGFGSTSSLFRALRDIGAESDTELLSA